MHIAIYPDIDTLSHDAAQHIVRIANESIATYGRFTMALSGGTTPRKTYELLGSEPYSRQINWTLVHIFWGDERCVPPESPDSNYRMAHEILLSKIPIPAVQVHRILANEPDRDESSQEYVVEMQRVFENDALTSLTPIPLDLVLERH